MENSRESKIGSETSDFSSISVTTLATVIAQLGPVALKYIQEVRNWLNRKKIDRITRDLNSRISQVKDLGRSIHSYRLLNLHVTQIIDDAQGMPLRILHLKELGMGTSDICKFIAQDLGKISDYFDQNLGSFPTNHLDSTRDTLIKNLIDRVRTSLASAKANLQNQNLNKFDEDLLSITKECINLRGETFYASDKIAEEIGKI